MNKDLSGKSAPNFAGVLQRKMTASEKKGIN